MLQHTRREHYNLITWNQQAVFRFSDLPPVVLQRWPTPPHASHCSVEVTQPGPDGVIRSNLMSPSPLRVTCCRWSHIWDDDTNGEVNASECHGACCPDLMFASGSAPLAKQVHLRRANANVPMHNLKTGAAEGVRPSQNPR